MKFLSILTLALLLLLPGCGCKDSEMVTVLLSEDFKRYTDFPEGSWWVYEKIDEPDVKDSIYIYSSEKAVGSNKHEKCYNFESIILGSYYSSRELKDSINFVLNAPIFSNLQKEEFSLFSNVLFFWPNELNEKYTVEIIGKQDRLNINGMEFFNTITTFHSIGEFVVSEIYAQDVGVVRRVYRDSSIYELKAFFINK